jgi:hypothetical protein
VSPTSRTVVATWLGAAVLGLTACGDDEESGGPLSPTPSATTSESATAANSPDPGTDPSESASSSPAVAPAAGIELREQTSSIHVPEGWRAAPPLSSSQSGATGPRGAGTIDLIDDETLNPGAPLELRVKSAMQTLPDGAKVTRLPDVMLGDSVAFHLTYTKPGSTEVTDIIETERNERLITMDFYLSADALKKDPDIVASVLASFQWVG